MCGITLVIPGAADPAKLLPRPGLASFGHWYAAQALDGAAASVGQLIESVAPALQRRGPDAQSCTQIGPATLASTVLGLRGNTVTAQPLTDSCTGVTLGWNGELFGSQWFPDELTANDTQAVLAAVSRSPVDVVLSSLEGPFACVVWDPASRQIWFARDALGRRSLVAAWSGTTLVVTSVSSIGLGWCEIPPGLYCMPTEGPQRMQLQRRQWRQESAQAQLAHHLSTMAHPAASEGSSCSVLDQFSRVLDRAVHVRVATTPGRHVAVMFSGGLDSAVLAALAHAHVPIELPIELINVSFGKQGNFDTPDRLTALSTLIELQDLAPNRCWKLVCVDVSLQEAAATAEHIAGLVRPLDTVMDHNIGMAFWFGARGVGALPDGTPHTVQAKVLLMGAGADEQLAGYTRHRTAWQRGGAERLQAELQVDFARLWTRNLGRDDRCVSDNAREARYPYLDENVVQLLCHTPLEQIATLEEPAGEGDKQVLRHLARRLGLTGSSRLVKRAIQFGSRVAKMVNLSKAKGDDKVKLADFEQLLREAEQGNQSDGKKVKAKNQGRTKAKRERLTADQIEALQQAAAKRQAGKVDTGSLENHSRVQSVYFVQCDDGFVEKSLVQ